MPVTVLEIKTRTPIAGGLEFGGSGTYELLDGTVHFAVDPEHTRSKPITDLKLAPCDARGSVTSSADFSILKPVELQRGNRRLLLDVLNRGRRRAMKYFNSAPDTLDPLDPLDPGNGFLMRQGYSVVWCGWQHDIPQVNGLLGMRLPDAVWPDGAISGKIAVAFQPNVPSQVQTVSDRLHRPYPTIDTDDQGAVLTVRDNEDSHPQEVPRERWRFARLDGEQAVPDSGSIYMLSGFVPGKMYRVLYTTQGAPVLGLGFLATLDLVSFLRYGTALEGNPCADHMRYAYAFGASQSGRFLRQMLYSGLNQDENDRMVFDGIIAHIAGSRRGEFNQRFGQPSSTSNQSIGTTFPFTDSEQVDPETGRTEGLLSRIVAAGVAPKVFLTHSSAEYWRGDASRSHTDVEGTQDHSPTESVRIYHYAGTQHASGTLPMTDANPLEGSHGQQMFNSVDYTSMLRAALVRLDRWVTSNELPPPSVHPRIDDGTAVPSDGLASVYRSIPGVDSPSHLPRLSRLDFGPEAEDGIAGTLPPTVGKAYRNLVPAVDKDGNEVGGIRLPDISVPLATHTGWNLRHLDMGSPDQIIGLTGSTIPFLPTKAQRDAVGDPRLSLEERYHDEEDYLGRVRKAATDLVVEGYLLAEDVEVLAKQASAQYRVLRRLVPETQPADD